MELFDDHHSHKDTATTFAISERISHLGRGGRGCDDTMRHGGVLSRRPLRRVRIRVLTVLHGTHGPLGLKLVFVTFDWELQESGRSKTPIRTCAVFRELGLVIVPATFRSPCGDSKWKHNAHQRQ